MGNLYTNEEANKQGQDFGDEYFAELDLIEVVEGRKDGYESDYEGIYFFVFIFNLYTFIHSYLHKWKGRHLTDASEVQRLAIFHEYVVKFFRRHF